MQLNKDISRTNLPKKEKSNTDLSITHSIPIHSLNPLPYGEDEAAQPPERKRAERNDAYRVYEEIIKDNIAYDILLQDRSLDRDRLNEIVDLMLETVCTARKKIRIAGDDYPAELVKSKFMKLSSEHIRFVLDCMEIETIQSAVAGVRRINGFLAQAERIPTAETAPQAVPGAPSVELQNVHFGYESDEEVLHGLSFAVQKGEQVTLTGRTGAGKSTIFKLLLGLYRPQQGQVMLNGVEAATLPDTARRPLVGYVEQSFRRVPGTVRDQITLFDAAITPQQAEDAARTVGLHDAIAALPEGYDTPCTPGIFSQGQWQLLSIARAIAAGPQILLLDEITANLDAGTEQTVLDALQRAGQNRTVVSISHRLYNRTGGRSVEI